MGCCKGNCCAVFTFPSTPEQLRERWEGKTPPESDKPAYGMRDDLYIADMLIPLDLVQMAERREEFGIRDAERNDLQWYTCHHWDEASGLCKAYSQRPKMCEEYPYDGKCDHGCDYEAPPHTKVKWAGVRVKQYNPLPMLNA